MQLSDLIAWGKALGPEGLAAIPIKQVLAFPGIQQLVPASVLAIAEELGVNATIGDIPSEAWVGIALTAAEKSLQSSLISNEKQVGNLPDDSEHGMLVICKSCKEPHWYE